MGITGLLPLLKPVTKDMHIRQLKGLTVGVDMYCWLHKGIYSCSPELCQGIPTDKFIKYCVERVHLLLSHGITPYLVFDGGYLPAKAGKEEERRSRRESNLQRGMQLTREGNASGAHQFFCKAADVTPFMAHQVIQVVKRIPGVRYVVAPYEADAQLGFLARNGQVDAVITEDSDIMLFGCNRVVFKLDRDGTGQEVDLSEVFSQRNDELDMRGMNEDDLMTLCALSGCDYLPSVHGMGLKKAYRMVSRHKELPKILRAVKFDSAAAFPRGYEADFQRALLTFRHQRAFDPVSRSVVHMTPLPESLPDAIMTPAEAHGSGSDVVDRAAALAFLGPPVAQERGCAVADGDMDPITGEVFSEMGGEAVGNDVKTPESALSEAAVAALAAWRGTSVPAPSGLAAAKKKLSAQGNNLTKYWGAPVSSSQKKPRARVGGRGGSGSSSSSSSSSSSTMAADRSFEFGATPDRPPRGTAHHPRSGGGCCSGTAGTTGGQAAKSFDLDRGSPAPPPSCVSPGSFYAGVNPSPPRPSPTSGNASGDDADVDASEDKENNRPLPDGGNTTRLREEAGGLLATSKFFGGGGGDRGGGGKGPLGQQSGLRGRFRPPLAAARHSSAAAPAASCLGKGRGGGGGEKIGRDDDNNGNPDSWGAEFAYPRLHVSRETPGNNVGCGSEGNTGVSVGGSRLKRRRTLGVRSLLPNDMKRGLEGTAGIGGAWLGRRSKSLGVHSGPVSNRHDGANDDVGDDAGCGGGGGGNGDDGCVNNLFEKFAARPQQRSPSRTAIRTSDRPALPPLPPPPRKHHTVPAAAAAAGAAGGKDAEGCGDASVQNDARRLSPLVVPSVSPPTPINSPHKGRVGVTAQRTSRTGGARDGGFQGHGGGGFADRDKKGECDTTTKSRRSNVCLIASNSNNKYRNDSDAGDRKVLCEHDAAEVAGRSERRGNGRKIAGGVLVGDFTTDLFAQFTYSPT
ncbi:unnamed protein product [Pylaiella littoralis]